MQVKRNQIEHAIRGMLGDYAPPPRKLSLMLKRLLDFDRRLGRKPRTSDPEKRNFAFQSHEPAGTGSEVWFSIYEAFALLTGVWMLLHGLPQGEVVTIMRRMRPILEAKHGALLKEGPDARFDPSVIKARQLPGALVLATPHPEFLVLRADGEIRICDDKALMSFMKEKLQSYFVFELVAPTFDMLKRISTVEPRRRGRAKKTRTHEK